MFRMRSSFKSFDLDRSLLVCNRGLFRKLDSVSFSKGKRHCMTFWPLHIIIIIGNDIAVNNTAFVLFKIFCGIYIIKTFIRGEVRVSEGKEMAVW